MKQIEEIKQNTLKAIEILNAQTLKNVNAQLDFASFEGLFAINFANSNKSVIEFLFKHFKEEGFRVTYLGDNSIQIGWE
jgi:hypothetical protein